jgi:hypothetical protein
MPTDAYKISRLTQQQKDTLTKVPFDEVAFLDLFTKVRRFMIGIGAIANVPYLMIIILGAYFITPREATYPLILLSLATIITGLFLITGIPYIFFRNL